MKNRVPAPRPSRAHSLAGLLLAAAVALTMAPSATAQTEPSIGAVRSNGRLTLPGPEAEPGVSAPATVDPSTSAEAPAADPVAAGAATGAAPVSGRAADRRSAFGRRPLGGELPEAAPAPALGSAASEASASGSGHMLPAWIDPSRNEIVRTGLALGVVLAIAVFLSRFVKRLGGLAGGGRPSGVLEVMARYPVGRGQQVLVLRLGRRAVLVHQAGSTMRTLTEVVDRTEFAALVTALEAGAGGSDAVRFQQLLADLETGRQPMEDLDPDRLPARPRRHPGAVAIAAPAATPHPLDPMAAGVARPRALAALRAAARAGGQDAAGVPVVDLTRKRSTRRGGTGR